MMFFGYGENYVFSFTRDEIFINIKSLQIMQMLCQGFCTLLFLYNTYIVNYL